MEARFFFDCFSSLVANDGPFFWCFPSLVSYPFFFISYGDNNIVAKVLLGLPTRHFWGPVYCIRVGIIPGGYCVFLLAKERSDFRTLQPPAAKTHPALLQPLLAAAAALLLRESTYHHRWFCRRYG